MSDMTLGEWSRETASAAAGPARSPIPLLLGRPLVVAGALITSALVVFLAAAIVAALAGAPKPFAMPRPATDTVMATIAPINRSPVTPTWVDIVKPIEIFGFEPTGLAKAPRSYTAKRNAVEGGRRDVIALGALMGDEPAMRLSLYRREHTIVAVAPIFADLTRLAAETGLSVTRAGLPDLLQTRFGAFEVVALGLARGQNPAVSCSGFRLVANEPALTISGLACDKARTLTRSRLGCLLDRIDLAASGGDRPLVDFFAASELRRDMTCEGVRLGPNAVHAAWLDDRAATPRKIRRRHR